MEECQKKQTHHRKLIESGTKAALGGSNSE